MKTTFTTLIITALLLCSCTDSKKSDSVDFISVHINDVKKRIEVPLSSLVESLEMVHLEDKHDAFSRIVVMYVTENYIGIRPGNQGAFKLFDRQGKFLGNIGRIGQGPGEYASTVYHAQICEKAERVYLIPWANSNRIMVYNLQGQWLESEEIPFAFPTRKAIFYVDNTQKQTVVMTLPFQGSDEHVVWVQDFEGNAIQTVSSEGFAVVPDFSNEVYSFRNTDNFDFQLMQFWQTEQDTLYHYDTKNNVIKPVFTFEAPVKSGEVIYSYKELPRHYLVDISVISQTSATTYSGNPDRLVIIDKATQEAQFVQIVNDYLGNLIGIGFWNFRNGYFTQNFEPMELRELLEEALEKDGLQPDVRQRIIELNKQLHPNGNDVVLIGKLKQNPAIKNFNEVEQFHVPEVKTVESVIPHSDDDTVHNLVDMNPEFEGGHFGPINFFKANLIFPEDAKAAGISRTVWVSAVIEKDGTLSDIRVSASGISVGMQLTDRQPAGTYPSLENEAVRLVRIMPKAVTPAVLNGKAVRCRYMFPVKFSLE